MAPYEVYLNLDLVDAVPKSGAQRQRIMEFVHGLRERPRTAGDYTDKDVSLRVRQIKVIGDYAITYWLDDPVKAVDGRRHSPGRPLEQAPELDAQRFEAARQCQ